MTDIHILDDLKNRGLLSVSTDEESLKEYFSSGEPITFYCGFDPTASSLHLGHLVQILTMRRLQNAGHRPIAVVGGATGLIGDPRPTSERQLNDMETVKKWSQNLRGQIEKFFCLLSDNPLVILNNYDWVQNISAVEFLRDIGKNFRVSKMLSKEAVSARLASEEGISYTEFSYQILQSYDFYYLSKHYGVSLQIGGQDQWGNITQGLDFIKKTTQKELFAFGTPIITNSDGTKFGKSEGNAIWLDPDLLSPYKFYQFWLNAQDADVIKYLKIFTFLSFEEIDELDKDLAEIPNLRNAQKALAFEVTSLVHSKAIAEKVRDASEIFFGTLDISQTPQDILEIAVKEIPNFEIDFSIGQINILDCFLKTSLIKSLSDGKRFISQGGLYFNDKKVIDPSQTVSFKDLLYNKYGIFRKGKKSYGAVVAKGTKI